MKEEIKVCNSCGHPIIFTFAFDGYEFYCPTCGRNYMMFDSYDEVEATPELKKEKEELEAWWKKVYAKLLPRGATKRGCKKCGERREKHYMHATKKEKANHEWAESEMKRMAVR